MATKAGAKDYPKTIVDQRAGCGDADELNFREHHCHEW
ncbi:MAG: hypothetical protein ACI814_000410, partial [Mariniblastus sp.]